MSTISEDAARQSSYDRHMDQALAIVAPRPPQRPSRPLPDDARALLLTHPACLPVSKRGRP